VPVQANPRILDLGFLFEFSPCRQNAHVPDTQSPMHAPDDPWMRCELIKKIGQTCSRHPAGSKNKDRIPFASVHATKFKTNNKINTFTMEQKALTCHADP